jgi:phage tail-like protein
MRSFVMWRVVRRRQALAAVGVVLLLAAVTGVVLANARSIPNAEGVFYGCYLDHQDPGERQGNLRLVSDPDQCRANETAVSWNQVGPEGPRGLQGPPGDPVAIEFDGPVQCRPVLPHQLPGGGSAVGMLRLALDGVDLGAFDRAYGLGSCSEVVAFRDGTDVEVIRLLPGRTIVQDPVLTRGLTEDTGVYDWRRDVMVGDIASARGAVTVTIFDTLSEAAWEVRLLNTWPSQHSTSFAGTPETKTEEVTLAVEAVLHQAGPGILPVASGFGLLERDGALDPFVTMESVGSSTEVVEHVPGGGGPTVKVPGALSFEFLVLRRGLSDSMSWVQWREQVDAGDVAGARQHVSLVLLDESSVEIARYNILNAWPAGYSVGFDGAMAVEQLVLVHEGFELVE